MRGVRRDTEVRSEADAEEDVVLDDEGEEEIEDDEEEDDPNGEEEEEEEDEEEEEEYPTSNPISTSFQSRPTPSISISRTPTTTILQARHSRISGPFTSSPSSPPNLPNLSGYASISSGYQSNSMFFPIDNQPNDLLGLDWDEWGESLFVATGNTVWEFEVDGRGRRCFGDWETL